MSGPLGALPALSRSARRALALGAVLAAANAVALVVQAWALASALAEVVTRGAGAEAIGGRLGVLVLAIAARALLGWATEAVSARAAAGAKEELRGRVVDAALRRGPEWVQRRGPAELTALATKGLDALDAYFAQYLPALLTAAVVPLLVGASILYADPSSALLIVLTVPLIPLFAWLVGRYTEQRTARAADAVQRLSGRMHELVRALPVLTAFGRAEAQRAAVRRVSEQHRTSAVATLRIAFLSALVLELFSALSVALVAVGIGMRLVHGELDLTTGLLVLVLVPECYLPLRAAGAAHHASEDGVEAVRRVHEIVADAPEPAPAGRAEVPAQAGALEVRDLAVARRGGRAPDGLGFTARPGEVLRLEGFDGIGPSGSGKSTTFGVLLGFTTAERGSVRYAGAEIAEFEPAAWRRTLAWVPQRPVFTGGTVADELAVAVADQPAGTAAAIPAVLDEVSAGHLHERRVDGLSAGERQRVAVARALLRLEGGARVLLLDEPTAHLDQATAHRVDAAIRRAAERGAVVVLASHRPDAAPAEPVPAEPGAPGEVPGLAPARGRLRELITRRALGGVGLAALSLLSGIALTATAAWLISRASQQPPVLTLTVAAVGVRTFALSRAALRYLERLVSHDAAFRLAGALRERLWAALVRLGPARTAALRRGDGAARLVDDADAVRDLLPRVLLPPLVGGVVALGAVVLELVVLPAAGLVLAAALLLAGVGGSAAALLAERRATTAAAEGRRRISARLLALLDGSAELLAFGAHRDRRAELARTDAELAARARRAAFGAGAATAVQIAAIGLAVLGGAYLGAEAVAAGRLAPVLAPLLALVPLAAAEAVGALPAAAQQWRSLRAAHDRLAPLLAAAEPAARDAAEGPARSDAAQEPAAAGAAGRDGAEGSVRRDVARQPAASGTAPRHGAAGPGDGADQGPAAAQPARRATAAGTACPDGAEEQAGRSAARESVAAESAGGDTAQRPAAAGSARGDGAGEAAGRDAAREPAAAEPAARDAAEGLGAEAGGAGHRAPAGDSARPDDGAADFDQDCPGIELHGVAARWPGAAEPSLREATAEIPPGAHIAVVGPSGSGKSTLLAVLLGFLEPERGSAALPARAAWCPQEPHLVSTTIRENLRMADPRAGDARLAAALRLAGLPGWEQRLDEHVGAGGTALSGGEAQRLALARALLGRGPLLLDEPTAHLDVPTAQALLARLRAQLPHRTVLHVTHRPAETADADAVLRIDRGALTVERRAPAA